MDFVEFQRDREFLPHDHTRVQESQHMSENEQNAQSQLIWAAGQIKWPHEMFLTVLCIAELCGCSHLMLLAVLCTPVCVLFNIILLFNVLCVKWKWLNTLLPPVLTLSWYSGRKVLDSNFGYFAVGIKEIMFDFKSRDIVWILFSEGCADQHVLQTELKMWWFVHSVTDEESVSVDWSFLLSFL